MSQTITFAILGDSAVSGVGDYDQAGRTRGWCHHLASAFQGVAEIIQVSRPGAKSDEVLDLQLPRALAFNPDLTAVVVGGNDALRNDFCPQRLYDNLRAIVHELRSQGSEVMMLQLHDPTQIIPLPRLLQRVLQRRIDAVNSVYERIVQESEVLFLRTRNLPNVYHPSMWHFDRMHPSKTGHLTIAENFRQMLVAHSWRFQEINFDEITEFSKRERTLWMLKNATPWFLKRSFDLLPAALYLMSREAILLIWHRLFSNRN